MSQTIDRVHDLRSIIEESKAKRVEDSSLQPQLKPRVVDLREQLNTKSEDIRIKLNRPKRSDLRRKLEVTKAKNDEGEAQILEEQPCNRRRVQVILARPSSSSDEEEDSKVRDSRESSNKRPSENGRPEESNDLRNKHRRMSQTIDRVHDLRSIIEESKAKRVEDSSLQPQLKPRVVDLRDQLNSKSEDLRIKLNRPKRSDLR
ncbi:hypothetical protein F2Q70_00036355 [Brassica cretica]|uniref:Uncharacterized protein n=1 Tax=Brassica cretica TaxID=69181 RepID=A0A8S9JWT1_BRACR|nr:hypothetical protein F2Q70_00036355 [Brassica cretica]